MVCGDRRRQRGCKSSRGGKEEEGRGSERAGVVDAVSMGCRRREMMMVMVVVVEDENWLSRLVMAGLDLP